MISKSENWLDLVVQIHVQVCLIVCQRKLDLVS